jgi:predicted ATPase/DNA-binding SARP family transcriptional activator
MEFRILGSFEVVGSAGLVDLRGAKRRGLLACLVVHAGQPMSTDRLVDELWGDGGSEGAARTVQTYMSQLRKLVRGEPASLDTRPGGYVLDVDPAAVDAYRFEQGVTAAGGEPDPARRLAILDGALMLWRGPPLGEFAGAGWADREATRLEALHLQAMQRRYDTLLDLDRAGDAVAELEALVRAHPLDERLWAQLMLALYRSGRQADALAAYQQARRLLVDELGIEPGPELAELEHRILAHDPSLATPTNRAPMAGAHRVSGRGAADGWYPRTFLLTDIVDSVSLWERDPAGMSDAVARHDLIIEDAVGAADGELVRTKGEGDSTFSVFAHPADALAAAATLHESLASERSSTTAPLRVRAGVHTGDAECRNRDWYGPAVNRAARLRALANGAQTLVSGVTAGLVADQPPEGMRLLYRGRRTLRGIERPEEVWELVADDDPRLAARTLARVDRLPVTLTRFVGRTAELDHLVQLIEDEPLVTLTGPGGGGKTRLAMELARHAARRGQMVWLAELAPLRDGALVAQAVATAVGFETGPDPLGDLLAQAEVLSGLLVLDNCEHLLDACTALTERLLSAVPHVRVLATSREPLGLAGEQEWPVRPLDVPDESLRDQEQLAGVESVQLLLDRARAVRPDFEVGNDDVASVVGICRALDGIPLAVELAAGRLRSLSLADLAGRLDDQVRVLARLRSSGRDEARHRTLRMTLDWSYDLLTDQQQTLARRLSVFAGGFRLDAAEAVCGGDVDVLDGIDELVAKSLVTFDGVTARYRVLEPIRQYLAERLDETRGTDAVQRDHAGWVANLAEAAERGFFTGQAMWMRRLKAEGPNIRVALEGALGRGDGVTALRIAAALGYPWFTIGQPDGWVLLDRALAAAGPVDGRLRARALLAAGMLAQDASEWEAAGPLLEEALDLFRACGSRRGKAWTLTWLSRGPATLSDETSRARLEEALTLFRETRYGPGIAWSLAFLASLRFNSGDVEGARGQAEEALEVATEAGATQPMAEAIRMLGMIAFKQADLAQARQRFEDAAAIHRSGGDRQQETLALGQAGSMAALMGDISLALDYYARSVDLVDDIASPDRFAALLQGFVPFLWDVGRQRDAAHMLGAYDAIRSVYYNDFIRAVATRVRTSDLEVARTEGTRLSFREALAMAKRIIHEERTRVGNTDSGSLPPALDSDSVPSGE